MDIHQADTLSKGSGKRIEDVNCRDEPVCESLVAILGLFQCGYLLSEDGQNCFRRIASLKPGK